MDKKNTILLNLCFFIVSILSFTLVLLAGLNGYIQSKFFLILILFSIVFFIFNVGYFLCEKLIITYKLVIKDGTILCISSDGTRLETNFKDLTKIELFKGSYENQFISLEFKNKKSMYFNYRDLVNKFHTKFNKKNIQNNDLKLLINYIKGNYIQSNDKGKQKFWKKYFGIVYYNQYYFEKFTTS